MKTVGIIAEYNPFHNGHQYHVNETKKQLNADCVIAMMSGNFTQRGEIALFDMYSRAEIAIKNGVDLVLEIPPQFVLNSAEFYAYYGVYLLHQLGVVDYLSFGSECGDLSKLQSYRKPSSDMVKAQMKSGISYGKAVGTSPVSQTPNNILGIEYLHALDSLKSNIIPFTLARKAVEHTAENPVGHFASASWIRKQLHEGKTVAHYVSSLPDVLPAVEEALFPLLQYCLIMGSEEELSYINNISEGLENRILANRNAVSFSDLIAKIKCKRYPETRIRRALYSILLNLKKTNELPSYTRVLAYNETGQKMLRNIKQQSSIPVFSRITKKDIFSYPQLQKELLCNEIYEMAKKKIL